MLLFIVAILMLFLLMVILMVMLLSILNMFPGQGGGLPLLQVHPSSPLSSLSQLGCHVVLHSRLVLGHLLGDPVVVLGKLLLQRLGLAEDVLLAGRRREVVVRYGVDCRQLGGRQSC